MRNHYRRFILIVLLPVLLLLPAGAANWLFLENTGELTTIEDVVARQQNDGGLYGTAIHPNDYAYKLALLAARQPEIVAIGSSRVLQFRQSQFTRPFVNLGRTINYPAEAVKLVEDMLAISTPRVVLFGIDHYWLNPAFTTAPDFRTHDLRGGRLTPDALITPVRWLVEGRLSFATYRAFLEDNIPTAPDDAPLIGVRAILDGAGFGPDGSWYYDHTIFGRRAAEDPRFRDTLRRISTGSAQFRYGTEIDRSRLADLRQAISRLEEAGVQVVTFVPPMASLVRQEIRQRPQSYAYEAPARAAIARLNADHLDLLEGTSIGIPDCEYVDGFHVGEVGSMRILRELSGLPDQRLAAFIDRAALTQSIAAAAGRASVDIGFRRDGETEGDFLELGCQKSALPGHPEASEGP